MWDSTLPPPRVPVRCYLTCSLNREIITTQRTAFRPIRSRLNVVCCSVKKVEKHWYKWWECVTMFQKEKKRSQILALAATRYVNVRNVTKYTFSRRCRVGVWGHPCARRAVNKLINFPSQYCNTPRRVMFSRFAFRFGWRRPSFCHLYNTL